MGGASTFDEEDCGGHDFSEDVRTNIKMACVMMTIMVKRAECDDRNST